VRDAAFALVVALAWFGAVNVAVSAMAAALAWLLERGTLPPRFANAPGALLALKLLPGAASLFFVLCLLLPAQWRFEPRDAEESAGYCMGALAVMGAATLVLSARRALRDTRVTRGVQRGWLDRAGEPLPVPAGGLPVYCLPDADPVVSLAGIRRPRLFVGRRVLDALSAEELDVSLAHELAHHATRDNLKRLLVAFSPDLLTLWRPGRTLERRWRAAVEFAADARAAGGDERRAVTLASALLKVARLAVTPPTPAGAGIGFYDGTLLWARVERLLTPAQDDLPGVPAAPVWSLCAVSLAVLAAAVTGQGAWLSVHTVTEGLIRFLP
jgi:hypothetical protein